jgi:hypothetical protein
MNFSQILLNIKSEAEPLLSAIFIDERDLQLREELIVLPVNIDTI